MADGKSAKLRVTQIASPIGRHPDQRATLIGLGLNKISRSKVWADEPAVRGRINRVKHLVRVEPVDDEPEQVQARKNR